MPRTSVEAASAKALRTHFSYLIRRYYYDCKAMPCYRHCLIAVCNLLRRRRHFFIASVTLFFILTFVWQFSQKIDEKPAAKPTVKISPIYSDIRQQVLPINFQPPVEGVQNVGRPNIFVPVHQQVPIIAQGNLPKSITNKIAILVVDDRSNGALTFLNSARPNFQLTSLIAATQTTHSIAIATANEPQVQTIQKKVTYFVFTSNKTFSIPEATENDSVRVISIGEDVFEKANRNPCKIYSKFHSERLGYFDKGQFDHALSFDSRMRVVMPINLHDEMLSELIGVTHPSFFAFYGRDPKLMPFDRRHKSCAFVAHGSEDSQGYFSGNLFGGEAFEFAKMCKEIASCPNGDEAEMPEFHQVINHYFLVKKHPTRTLNPSFCYATGLSELPFYPQKIQLNDRLPDDPQLANLAEMPDEQFFQRRENQIQKLVQNIKENYIAKVAKQFSQQGPSRMQFLAYRCDSGSNCGDSVADQIRGAASLLYLAIAWERTYNLQWVNPVDVGKTYFAVNEKWYNVTATEFQAALMQSSYKPRYLRGVDNNGYEILSVINSWKSNEFSRKVDVLLLTTNLGKNLLETLFRVPSFYPVLHSTIPDMPEYKSNVNYGVYLSAAMRVIFGQPSEKLNKVLNDVISGEPNWDKAFKIGIQIANLAKDQWQCFAEKAVAIVQQQVRPLKRRQVIVLVTSDFEGDDRNQVLEVVRKVFKKLATINELLKVVDFKQPAIGSNSQLSSALFDWYLLTKMDWLVITKGGFGEMASLYSMKPTNRNEVGCHFAWYNADIGKTDRF